MSMGQSQTYLVYLTTVAVSSSVQIQCHIQKINFVAEVPALCPLSMCALWLPELQREGNIQYGPGIGTHPYEVSYDHLVLHSTIFMIKIAKIEI